MRGCFSLFALTGARILPAEDSASLERSFRQALNARHTAATKMNERSSRSHLIIGLVIESTSKVNGTVLRGKVYTRNSNLCRAHVSPCIYFFEGS
jgi:hypothetical protein